MDGLRLALIIAGIALVAAVYLWSARRQRIERDAGEFDRFDAWADEGADPLVDPDDAVDREARTQPNPLRPGARAGGSREQQAAAPASPAAGDAAASRDAPPVAAVPRDAPAPKPAPSRPASRPEPPREPDPLADLEAVAAAASPGERAEPRLGALDEVQTREPEPRGAPAAKATKATKPAKPTKPAGRPAESASSPAPAAAAAGEPEPELVVVLHVMAPPETRFEGPAVRDALERAGLRAGEMQLYHYRSEAHPADAPPVFSALNAVKPGTLDPAEFDTMRTPGIALVLRLPGIERPREAFELMHSTGQAIAGDLGGQLCDERRSTLTRQVLNHLREQIAEHVRRRRVGG